MQKALMQLNLYGCEAVRHKLKNGLKTQKMHFLPLIELMSDSPESTKQMEEKLNFQVPAEGLELVILLHTQF